MKINQGNVVGEANAYKKEETLNNNGKYENIETKIQTKGKGNQNFFQAPAIGEQVINFDKNDPMVSYIELLKQKFQSDLKLIEIELKAKYEEKIGKLENDITKLKRKISKLEYMPNMEWFEAPYVNNKTLNKTILFLNKLGIYCKYEEINKTPYSNFENGYSFCLVIDDNEKLEEALNYLNNKN